METLSLFPWFLKHYSPSAQLEHCQTCTCLSPPLCWRPCTRPCPGTYLVPSVVCKTRPSRNAHTTIFPLTSQPANCYWHQISPLRPCIPFSSRPFSAISTIIILNHPSSATSNFCARVLAENFLQRLPRADRLRSIHAIQASHLADHITCRSCLESHRNLKTAKYSKVSAMQA